MLFRATCPIGATLDVIQFAVGVLHRPLVRVRCCSVIAKLAVFIGLHRFVLEDPSEHASGPASCQHLTRLLSEHLTLQGAADAAVQPLAKLFASQWASYLELMVSDDGTTVAVMTHGRGQQFTAQIQSLLRSCEIETAAADQILELAAALNHGRCLVQLSFVSGSCPQLEVSVCYRRTMHLDHGLRLIGADATAALDVRGCADLLHRCAISGIALSARRGAAAVRPAVHFTQVVTERRREAVRMRLAHAASHYAPCAAAVSRWAEHHDLLLSPERGVLSVAFTPANATHAAQVDIEYADVPTHAAARLVEEHASAAAERFEQLCARAGRTALSYLEVSLQQAQLPVLHAYACVAL